MRIPLKPEPEPGEWQQEPGAFGRRYRMVGGIKEYEMDINGVPESIFFASQRAQKERDAAQRDQEKREAAKRAAQRRNCPFKDSMQTDCTREACALFLNGCTLTRLTDRLPAKATEGLQCPFSRYSSKCRTDCALYNGGCTLTGINTNTESEDN